MWKCNATNFPSAMNSDHQVDDMEFDKSDKSKPNGMYKFKLQTSVTSGCVLYVKFVDFPNLS